MADEISRLDWTGLGSSMERTLECKYTNTGPICSFWNCLWDEITICSCKNDYLKRYISRLVKYNKKVFQYLTAFFMTRGLQE